MPKRTKSREPVDRAAEYIDSPLMKQRLRHGNRLSVSINGNYGTYRTEFSLGKHGKAHCTCPSEQWPCKHIRALEATWKLNPESFFDLAEFLNQLQARSKSELVALISQFCLAVPQVLSVCGVEGFEDEPDNEDEYEYEY